jgi:hypothetical protein
VNDDGWLDLYVVDSGEDGAGGVNTLWINDRNGGFVAATPASGASPRGGEGRPVAAHFFDLDSDGRLDLFLTSGWGAPPFDRGPYRLLHNVSPPRHWFEVDLHGTKSNRQGLGARLELEACGRRQVRYHNGAASYFSQSGVGPHFGLGDCSTVSLLRVRSVRCRRGAPQRAADRVLLVVEEQNAAVTISARPSGPGFRSDGGGEDVARLLLRARDRRDGLSRPPAAGRRADRDRHAARRPPSAYGYALTRQSSTVSRDAVTYDEAIARDWTVPAHGSLFTGRWPSFHKRRAGGERSQSGAPVEPRRSDPRRVAAGARHAYRRLRPNPTYVAAIFGMARGSSASGPGDAARGPQISQAVNAWIERQRAPFFLFVASSTHPSRTTRRRPSTRSSGTSRGVRHDADHTGLGGAAITSEMLAHFASQYDGEIAVADRAVSAILSSLKKAGRYERALIIVTSMWGFLGEHRLAGHGLAPFEPEARAPDGQVPGRAPPRRQDPETSTMGSRDR